MFYVKLVFIIFGVLWTLAFLFLYFRAAGKSRAARQWPTAPGTVLSSEVQALSGAVAVDGDYRDTTYFQPLVTYSFSIADRELKGQRLRFGANSPAATRKDVEAIVARYPVGAAVAVRYNPDRPEDCILETGGASLYPLFLALLGPVIVIIALVMSD